MVKSVLLVEDEAVLLLSLTALLEEMGFEVLAAMNGQMALEILETESPDAVVSDLRLPDMSGLDLLHRIKENPSWGDRLLVLVTGAVDEIWRDDHPDTGLCWMLPKPFNPKELVAILQHKN